MYLKQINQFSTVINRWILITPYGFLLTVFIFFTKPLVLSIVV